MRLIDADALKRDFVDETGGGFKDMIDMWIDDEPTVDAIPVDWLENRLQETAEATAQGKDECDLNNAIFTVLVEWERWKKEHGEKAGSD